MKVETQLTPFELKGEWDRETDDLDEVNILRGIQGEEENEADYRDTDVSDEEDPWAVE